MQGKGMSFTLPILQVEQFKETSCVETLVLLSKLEFSKDNKVFALGFPNKPCIFHFCNLFPTILMRFPLWHPFLSIHHLLLSLLMLHSP